MNSSFRRTVRAVYRSVPFKRQVLSALRTVWRPKEAVYRHLHFRGPFQVLPKGGAPFMLVHHGTSLENDVFWRGAEGSEPFTMALWMQLAADARVVLDVGANTGYFALLATSMSDDSLVLAFEAVERIGTKARANAALNAQWADRIEVVIAGASDRKGTSTLYMPTLEHFTSASLVEGALAARDDVEPVQISTLTLDSAVADRGIGPVDLIKIDVEGHEPEVLLGAVGILENCPTLVIEVLDDAVGDRVQAVLDGRGYRYFSLDDQGARARPIDAIHRLDESRNVLVCLPEIAQRLGLVG